MKKERQSAEELAAELARDPEYQARLTATSSATLPFGWRSLPS